MRKTHWTALAAALLLGVSALAGCSKKRVRWTCRRRPDDLKAGVTFKDELAPPADAAFATLYDVKDGDVTKHAVYVSSGATAEEIAVFEAKDADAAARSKPRWISASPT